MQPLIHLQNLFFPEQNKYSLLYTFSFCTEAIIFFLRIQLVEENFEMKEETCSLELYLFYIYVIMMLQVEENFEMKEETCSLELYLFYIYMSS